MPPSMIPVLGALLTPAFMVWGLHWRYVGSFSWLAFGGTAVIVGLGAMGLFAINEWVAPRYRDSQMSLVLRVIDCLAGWIDPVESPTAGWWTLWIAMGVFVGLSIITGHLHP